MVFTAQLGNGTAQEIVIEEGSHVYCSKGARFAEWADLSAEQQEGLKNVQALLSDCFSSSMVSSTGLMGGAEAAA